jgi:hypothetical protein
MTDEEKKADKKRRQAEAWKRWYEKHGAAYRQKRKEREAVAKSPEAA